MSDNLKYGMVIRQVGSDDLGGGLSIPPYYFLQGSWRVRPMESSHTLIITGNIFVEGGGVPVVPTLGDYNVSVQYTVPVQAQGISTSGSTGLSQSDINSIASAVTSSIIASALPQNTANAVITTSETSPINATVSGGSSGGNAPSANEVATAVRNELAQELTNLDAPISKTLTTSKFLGLQ